MPSGTAVVPRGGRPLACLGLRIEPLEAGGVMTQTVNSQLQVQWARVRGRLRSEFGEAAFRNWLKKLTLVGLRGPELQLAVPTRFIRDWIGSNYSDRLLALWINENAAVRNIDLVVETGAKYGDEERAPSLRGPSAADSGRSE